MRSCHISPYQVDYIRSCQVLLGLVRFFQVLPSPARSLQVLQEHLVQNLDLMYILLFILYEIHHITWIYHYNVLNIII